MMYMRVKQSKNESLYSRKAVIIIILVIEYKTPDEIFFFQQTIRESFDKNILTE